MIKSQQNVVNFLLKFFQKTHLRKLILFKNIPFSEGSKNFAFDGIAQMVHFCQGITFTITTRNLD